jgi:UDP-3-O-[3-hydroxymyristoyl] glucosamine N-acyltransferase
MEYSAKQIAGLLNGRIEGDVEAKVSGLAKIEEGIPGTLCFLSNMAYEQHAYTTQASILIVNEDFVPQKQVRPTLIRVENAYMAFARLLEIVKTHQQQSKKGIEQPSFIHPTAKIGKDVYVGAFVYIGENAVLGDGAKIYPQAYVGDNASIGSGTVLFSGVKVYEHCIVGKECTLHSGVIIGGDGFGFAPNTDGNYKKVPQTGNVIIDDYVEVGANTTIDRATLGSTKIAKGVKLDNLIQVAHNVEIGENTVIAAQSGIAGSTKIGANCMIGGQVGIIGHLHIADGVKIAAQSGVGHSIQKEGEVLQGSPAFSIGEYKRSYIGFRRLPEILNALGRIEKWIKERETRP